MVSERDRNTTSALLLIDVHIPRFPAPPIILDLAAKVWPPAENGDQRRS